MSGPLHTLSYTRPAPGAVLLSLGFAMLAPAGPVFGQEATNTPAATQPGVAIGTCARRCST